MANLLLFFNFNLAAFSPTTGLANYTPIVSLDVGSLALWTFFSMDLGAVLDILLESSGKNLAQACKISFSLFDLMYYETNISPMPQGCAYHAAKSIAIFMVNNMS